jgi:two-component system OmpR family sensor kinase/two-component system sensor histidine kinase BaeS
MSLPSVDLHHSVRQIRRRLFMLLMQAFGAVVLLAVVLMLALLLFAFGNLLFRANPKFMPPPGEALQAYYVGRGSWDGIETILELENLSANRFGNEDWSEMILLDQSGRVLVDQGRVDTARIGQTYSPQSQDIRFVLRVRGEQVGTLVYPNEAWVTLPFVLGLLVSLSFPVIVISFFTGALTLLIGFLLARRVVTPLADVIGAAQAVAAGDLSARVQVRGPGDLRSLSDSFNRMADALERSDRERREFLVDIAHELRTPLTVIRGRLEGIVDGVYPADEDHVAPVLEETYVLERLVEDLRLLTLAESRQLHFDLQPILLGELAERAADLFRAEADDKHIDLSLRVDADTPSVVADPQRVGQVIGNLMSNALRYTPEHGRVSIEVRRANANGNALFVVHDTGPGVPEADLLKLFDRFWRGEKSRTRAAGGAGLGLAIARQLIEAQGGTISASNAPGGGLEVRFTLP